MAFFNSLYTIMDSSGLKEEPIVALPKLVEINSLLSSSSR